VHTAARCYRPRDLPFLRSVATRRASWLGLVLIGALGLAGCSAGQTTTPTTSSGTSSASSTTTTTATVSRVPTLGRLAGDFAQGKGWGKVKPSEIYNGGDPTGLVQHVVWTSWGGPKAVGTGMSDYVAANEDVAEGTQERATVVAFILGTSCDGKLMYQAVEWYFPQHGQSFDPNRYEDICTGSYVTTTATTLRCVSSQLRFAVARELGRAMSQDGLFFSYTNLSHKACTIEGYARVQVYSKARRPMLTRLAHGGDILLNDPGPRVVTLPSHARAYFGFTWPSTGQPNVKQTGCIDKTTVSSTPPGGSRPQSISLDFGIAPLTPVCRGIGSVTAIAPSSAFFSKP
jgi:hypothetical protein